MILTEFNEKKILRGAWREGKEEGIAEGKAEGRAEGIAIGKFEERITLLFDLIEEGLLSLDQAAEKAGMTVSEFKEKAARLKERKEDA